MEKQRAQTYGHGERGGEGEMCGKNHIKKELHYHM